MLKRDRRAVLNARNGILILGLFLTIILLIQYLMVNAYGNIYSDSAVKFLLAEKIISVGSLIPNSWYYANGDIWILSPHLFALPAVYLFGHSYLTYVMVFLASMTLIAVSAIYFIGILRILECRTVLINELKKLGVSAVFHYIPLHSSPGGVRYGKASGLLPVTDEYSERLVRLSMWVGLEGYICRVIDSVRDILFGDVNFFR